MAHEYRGKQIVITGAAGGIGRVTAKRLANAGADLHLIDLDADGLTDIASRTGASFAISTLETPAACAEAVSTIDQPVDGLVHLAGIFVPDELSADGRLIWDRVMAANLTNAFDIAAAVSPMMDEGRMVFASSLAYRRGSFDHIAYSAAKGGITGLVRALARRLAPKILVNGLAPGHIATNMPAHIWGDDARAQKMLLEIPLKRRGEPGEVASVIDFLLGPDSSYITGQVINIDGGIIPS